MNVHPCELGRYGASVYFIVIGRIPVLGINELYLIRCRLHQVSCRVNVLIAVHMEDFLSKYACKRVVDAWIKLEGESVSSSRHAFLIFPS